MSILLTKFDLDQDEQNLNRDLFKCFKEVCHRNSDLGVAGLQCLPVPEGKNPPHHDDIKRAKRENKIPDFQWRWHDDTEDDWDRAFRIYCLECKRLGKRLRSDRVLTQKYIKNGVLRFITEEHGYAKGEKSGAMIGYVQNMEFTDILREVNTAAGEASIPELILSAEGWQERGISHLDHELIRPFVVSPFLLKHFWVDLRH